MTKEEFFKIAQESGWKSLSWIEQTWNERRGDDLDAGVLKRSFILVLKTHPEVELEDEVN